MNILDILHIIASVLMVGLVILQQQDAGIYSATSNINRSRRGSDRLFFRLTIFTGIFLISISTINFLI